MSPMQKLMQKRESERLWLNSITDSMDVNLSKLWEIVRNREAWHVAVHGVQRVGHDSVTEQ